MSYVWLDFEEKWNLKEKQKNNNPVIFYLHQFEFYALAIFLTLMYYYIMVCVELMKQTNERSTLLNTIMPKSSLLLYYFNFMLFVIMWCCHVHHQNRINVSSSFYFCISVKFFRTPKYKQKILIATKKQ